MDTTNLPATLIQDPNKEIIQIKSRLKGEAFTLHLSDLIYIESEGNYIVFHLSQNGLTRKETIRNSISEVEQMLDGLPFIVRTHRAFIVNINKINKRSGNSSGYRLQLDGVAEQIPVSRSNAEKFDRLYSAMR
ncbi:LytTR family DNA-binding domain-containing protein [Dyadobacter sp. SG02]|uniref:LytR/AlgR family response regulator transcription factor n=1 Tax=Dyadobacter sp. SG02 TaxID=1855291 RepID=UPI0015A6C4A2|nr:LytTR family DNA-binding domain-containing protein [Dyadobacter sp. SG02]